MAILIGRKMNGAVAQHAAKLTEARKAFFVAEAAKTRVKPKAKETAAVAAPIVLFARVSVEIVPTKARPTYEAPVRHGTKPACGEVVRHTPRLTPAMLHAMSCAGDGIHRSMSSGNSCGRLY